MTFPKHKPASQLSWSNLGIGAAVSLFEVSTLGQPLEVLKTHQAANRTDSLATAIRKTYARGGVKGFYQGLIPWAWIESGFAGGVLIFTSSYVESFLLGSGLSTGAAGLAGGMLGGAAQGYLVMGVCTTMKTAEITRQKALLGQSLRVPSTIPGDPGRPLQIPSTWRLFSDMFKQGGIRGINKGVNAVALRQVTNWGSRMGFARASEGVIREMKGLAPGSKLGTEDKIIASTVGGVLGCWNHPIEVVRVEMQSLLKSGNRPVKPTIVSTFRYIYSENGIRGLFRGLTPRILLGVWRTVCFVTLVDYVKELTQSTAAASATRG